VAAELINVCISQNFLDVSIAIVGAFSRRLKILTQQRRVWIFKKNGPAEAGPGSIDRFGLLLKRRGGGNE
jgi:hypothetical protein